MSDVWLITRSLTDDIASNLTIDEAIENDYSMRETELSYKREAFGEPLKIKAGFDQLKISCTFKPAKELISPGYVKCLKNLPKLAIDGFHAYNHLHNHIDNLNALKEIGVKVVNDPDIHDVCSDKWKYYQIMENHKIPTIKSILLSLPGNSESIESIESILNYPVVIKPTNGTLNRGVIKCNTPDDVWYACSQIYKLPFKPKTAIIQKWIDHNIKGVLRTYMIGGNIVGCTQRRPSIQTDFFYAGSRENSIRTAYEITPKLIDYCKSIYLALNKIDICAIDILYDGKNYVACDINSPGSFVGTDSVLNTDIGKLIAEYMASKL